MASIADNRPVFDILDEPIMFRKFIQWTREGIKEAQTASEKMKEAANM